jgi:hypothetical protein
MSQVASTAAGVAIGRGIDRAFFGGGGGGGGEGGAAEVDPNHAGEAPGTSSFAAESPIPDSLCSRFVEDFKNCMDQSGHDVAACRWPMELLSQCQQGQQPGFADAGRL